MKKYNLIGKSFGRLTVINGPFKKCFPSGQIQNQWECQCECGNITYPSTTALVNGHTQSCGCLAKENAINAKRKTNKYDLTGEYGIGWTTNTNKEFYFDLEDYDKIKNYCWNENLHGYIYTKTKELNIPLHRFVMNVGNKNNNNVDVDHIGGNKTKNDNRKSNLRICTHAENMRNMKLHIDNKSGVTGVIWDKKYLCWQSHIKINYKKIHLGCFDSFEDAVKARKEAEEKFFGEFSYDNSQNIKNEIIDVSLKRKHQNIPIVCIETNTIFLSINDANRFLNKKGSNISNCINGKRKMAYGYHWRKATSDEIKKYNKLLIDNLFLKMEDI